MTLRIVVLAALAAFVALAASALAATDQEPLENPRCHGRQAEIVGTNDDDVLHGTPERDVIWGGKGDDTIYGSLGNDLLCGGPGADLVHGGRGNDEVDGGAGSYDRAIGDLGNDIVSGGAGDHDLVHGDYGWDRMSGGAGAGDVASFATAVAGGKGSGVWASLRDHQARGDGHDKLFAFEDLQGSAFRDTLIGDKGGNGIDGGPGNDRISGVGGVDRINGGQGTDGCTGAKGRTVSCGRERAPKASAYVQLDPVLGGGAGLQIVGGGGGDHFVVSFDEATETFAVSARKPLAIGPGCSRPPQGATEVSCPALGPGLWLTADLGPGNDSLRVAGSLLAVGSVRFAGGFGNDEIRGGPEDDLIESGPGSDRLYGGGGADGLIGGLPGPTYLYGEGNGDLLAAGGGCAGGAIVGGPGRDDASFAETQAHPGLLIVSFPRRAAWIDEVKGCDRVRLSPTNEDMEGSFDNDVLIGDARANAMLGQPGHDRFYGNGGDDVIDARDGVRDFSIQCAPGPLPKKGRPLRGRTAGRALMDVFDPASFRCAITRFGTPVPGLNG